MVLDDNVVQGMAEDFYKAAIEAGYTKEWARKISLRKIELEQKYSIAELEMDCGIRRQIPKRYLTGFEEMGEADKKAALHEMGISTYKAWWEDVCIFRERGMVLVEECVVGDERLDKAWTSLTVDGKHVASFAARVACKHDPSLERELRKLSGGGGI